MMHIPVGDNKEDTDCPKCKLPRYDRMGKPRAQFYYKSLKEWIKSVFASKTLAFLIRSAKRQVEVPNKVTDMWDGEVWKSTISDWAGDNSHWLGLSLVTDPIQVYETSQASICPLIFSVNNFPNWLRHLAGTYYDVVIICAHNHCRRSFCVRHNTRHHGR